jgi:hypothetical protein
MTIKTTTGNARKKEAVIWNGRWRPVWSHSEANTSTVKETTVAMVEYTCWDWSSRNDIYRMKRDCPSCYENENLKMNMNYVYWVPLTLTEWGPKLKRLDARSHRRVWPEKINMMTNALLYMPLCFSSWNPPQLEVMSLKRRWPLWCTNLAR